MIFQQILDKFLPQEESTLITDQAILDKFLKNPNFPWLISFPRTGSHWLRMLMELYFEKPSLRRAFFYHAAQDFTCYHWHDVDLSAVDVKSVIYLYRDPVETIYSTLQYHHENIVDKDRIIHWTLVYGSHLRKWLLEESFTSNKTLIRYDRLKNDLPGEFEKICRHFNQPYDLPRLQNISNKASKDRLKSKTTHDQQVVNVSKQYEITKEQFIQENRDFIFDQILNISPELSHFFATSI